MTYSVDAAREYIIQAAIDRGIDPNVALRVAESEGLKHGVWQSTVSRSGLGSRGGFEDSWGPYQLYMGGGLGNEMQAQTGLDPRDQNNWKAGIDFALDKAKSGGWGPWYGAKVIGITGFDGIDGTSAGYLTSSETQTSQLPESGSEEPSDFDTRMSELDGIVGNKKRQPQQTAASPLPQLQPIRASLGYL